MKETKEVTYCKEVLYKNGRPEKIKLLDNSNLNNHERDILYERFVIGLTVKETAEKFNVSIETINKTQKKSFFKLYDWLQTISI